MADDPAAAADAAWAASDFWPRPAGSSRAARLVPLTEAAQTYDQAARELHGKLPAPTAAGTGLRAAGRLLPAAQVAQQSETRQLLALMVQLSALTDAVTRHREVQDRAGQARAARQAAKALRAVTARYAGAGGPLAGAAATAPVASGLGGRGAGRAGPPERPVQPPLSVEILLRGPTAKPGCR